MSIPDISHPGHADTLVEEKFRHMMHDNTDVVTRKGYYDIVFDVWDSIRVDLRKERLPEGLNKLEFEVYEERIRWPKSIFKSEVLKSAVLEYSETTLFPQLVDPIYYGFDPFESGWIFDIQADRFGEDLVGADLSKSAGLPVFGPKRNNLGEARQYNSSVVKPNPTLANCYAPFVGWRTQMADPDGTPKVRSIAMVACQFWLLERESYIHSIAKAKQGWKESSLIRPYYVDEQSAFAWIVDKLSECSQMVGLDYAAYDRNVRAEEIAWAHSHMIQDYEFQELMLEYLLKAPIMIPKEWGSWAARNGGVLSGSTVTHHLDDVTNLGDTGGALKRHGTLRFVEFGVVNGDDLAFGVSTKFNRKQLANLGKYSLRTLSPDKCWLGQSDLWFSKQYFSPELEGATKPIALVVNSMAFAERQSDSIVASKEHQAITATQQMSYLRFHPLGPKFISEVLKRDRYPIDSQPVERLVPAAEAYLSSHNWAVETGQLDSDPTVFVRSLQDFASSYR
jgi:hypothetical protein